MSAECFFQKSADKIENKTKLPLKENSKMSSAGQDKKTNFFSLKNTATKSRSFKITQFKGDKEKKVQFFLKYTIWSENNM